MAEDLVTIENLSFGYRVGGFRLRLKDLRVPSGQRVAVKGPSGSGKTTLLHLMAGILSPAAGRVTVDGVTLSELRPEDRQDFRALRLGLVFQQFELLEYLSVFDNVLLPYRISPVLQPTPAVRQRVRDLCEAVHLGDKMGRYPSHLSQGERQRVALCRALVTEPVLILGDEPTGNLDPVNRDHVIDMLFQYAQARDAPLVIVTHDHELLDRFDRTIDIGATGL